MQGWGCLASPLLGLRSGKDIVFTAGLFPRTYISTLFGKWRLAGQALIDSIDKSSNRTLHNTSGRSLSQMSTQKRDFGKAILLPLRGWQYDMGPSQSRCVALLTSVSKGIGRKWHLDVGNSRCELRIGRVSESNRCYTVRKGLWEGLL